MNYFKNNNWVFWTIGLLVLLNVATLAMLWTQNNRRGSDHPRAEKMERQKGERSERGKGRIAKALDLTDEQAESFHTLMKEHKKEMGEHFKLIREKKKSKLEALTATPSDTATVSQLNKEITELNAEMESALDQHYYDLAAICNDEQKEKLKGVFKRIFKRERGHRERKGRKERKH